MILGYASVFVRFLNLVSLPMLSAIVFLSVQSQVVARLSLSDTGGGCNVVLQALQAARWPE